MLQIRFQFLLKIVIAREPKKLMKESQHQRVGCCENQQEIGIQDHHKDPINQENQIHFCIISTQIQICLVCKRCLMILVDKHSIFKLMEKWNLTSYLFGLQEQDDIKTDQTRENYKVLYDI